MKIKDPRSWQTFQNFDDATVPRTQSQKRTRALLVLFFFRIVGEVCSSALSFIQRYLILWDINALHTLQLAVHDFLWTSLGYRGVCALRLVYSCEDALLECRRGEMVG